MRSKVPPIRLPTWLSRRPLPATFFMRRERTILVRDEIYASVDYILYQPSTLSFLPISNSSHIFRRNTLQFDKIFQRGARKYAQPAEGDYFSRVSQRFAGAQNARNESNARDLTGGRRATVPRGFVSSCFSPVPVLAARIYV